MHDHRDGGVTQGGDLNIKGPNKFMGGGGVCGRGDEGGVFVGE